MVSSSPKQSCIFSLYVDPKDRKSWNDLTSTSWNSHLYNKSSLPPSKLSRTRLPATTRTLWRRQFLLLPSRCSAWQPEAIKTGLMRTMLKSRPCWKKSVHSTEPTRVTPPPNQREMLTSVSAEKCKKAAHHTTRPTRSKATPTDTIWSASSNFSSPYMAH